MVPISVEKFAEMTAVGNPDIDRDSLVASLRETLEDKKNGAKCMVCGSSIWAAGSAVTGNYMCSSCTMLEADDSEDYEVE